LESEHRNLISGGGFERVEIDFSQDDFDKMGEILEEEEHKDIEIPLIPYSNGTGKNVLQKKEEKVIPFVIYKDKTK
jgi:hypothetical protein